MLNLTVVTPVKVFYEDEVSSLTAPGEDGYLGILANHAPLITALKPGLLTIRDSLDTIVELAVSDGFLEVSQNRATILASAVEYVTEIDLERAKAALDRAEKRIKGLYTDEKVDTDRTRRALSKAVNRINLKNRLSGKR